MCACHLTVTTSIQQSWPQSAIPCYSHDANYVLDTDNGLLMREYESTQWPGMPSEATLEDGVQYICRIGAGDVVGLLLDTDAGSLAAYLKRGRCGLMVCCSSWVRVGGVDVIKEYSVSIKHTSRRLC